MLVGLLKCAVSFGEINKVGNDQSANKWILHRNDLISPQTTWMTSHQSSNDTVLGK